jgi:8-oxo-dGTP diphosphatase
MNTPEFKIRVRNICLHESKILLVINDRDKFAYIPGGKLNPFETIFECATRELKEELGDNIKFKFKKILYISEFHDTKRNTHNIEIFLLGEINKFTELEDSSDIEHNGGDHFSWRDINDLPKDLKPEILQEKLPNSFKNQFTEDTLYLGAN